MYGMLILLGAVAWLATALAPLVLFLVKRKWFFSGLIGLPFMLAVLAAPFWDYFFMVPAVNDAYERLAVSKVYKTSTERTIRVIHTANGVEVARDPVYEESLWRDQLDYIETLKAVQEKAGAPMVNTLVRYSKQAESHPLCLEQKIWGNKGRLGGMSGGLRKESCIIYEPILHSEAAVAVELGVVHIVPDLRFPDKQYQYSIWRATETHDNSVIAESVRGFIWDPDLCYWFNACRYVVDRESPANLDVIVGSVSNIVSKY